MWIEPLEPLTVRLPEGEKRLLPGKTYSFSNQQGEKLLAKAPDKVRVVYQLGQKVSYQTPVDDCIKKGTVELIDEHWGMVLVRGDEVAWVNQSFVTKVEGT